MGPAAIDQDQAYERAVREARADPALRLVVERAFLHERSDEAFAAFVRSEDWARARRLLRAQSVKPPGRVLDFGGGRGLMTAALARDGYDATLCEMNPSLVCGTGAAAALRADLRANFAIASGPVQGLAPDSFDAVICRAVLHHLDPLVPILRAVLATLRPGGAFVALDEPTIRHERELRQLRLEHPFVRFGVDERAYRASQYAGFLRSAGFADVRVVFPVAFADYRAHLHPGAASVAALARYTIYRVRSSVRPRPGDVRSLLARRPA